MPGKKLLNGPDKVICLAYAFFTCFIFQTAEHRIIFLIITALSRGSANRKFISFFRIRRTYIWLGTANGLSTI